MRQKEREAERRNNDRRLKHNRKQHRRTEILDVEKDRREILKGADYVIFMMQVGGYNPSTIIDFEIPKYF